jgi:hypothetical protein
MSPPKKPPPLTHEQLDAMKKVWAKYIKKVSWELTPPFPHRGN